MSQFRNKGINPVNGRPVIILFGYDEVPGYRPGFFFQAYDPTVEEDDGLIVNYGFTHGIPLEELVELLNKFGCKADETTKS